MVVETRRTIRLQRVALTLLIIAVMLLIRRS